MLRVLMSPLGVMKSATPQPVRPSGVTTSSQVPSTVRPISVMGVFVASCVMILPVVPGDSRTRRYWQVAQTLAVSTAVGTGLTVGGIGVTVAGSSDGVALITCVGPLVGVIVAGGAKNPGFSGRRRCFCARIPAGQSQPR